MTFVNLSKARSLKYSLATFDLLWMPAGRLESLDGIWYASISPIYSIFLL